MANYLHGAYGQQQAVGSRIATESQQAIVLVGTAPVNTIAGGAANVNVPVLVNDISEARRAFGYSDAWEKYTLCEAMHVFLELNGVGPLVMINVLDPATHKKAQKGSKSLTPANGRVTITNAGDIVLDSVVVKSGETTKTKDTDYTISYNYLKKTIVIAELTSGALGTTALTITYDEIDASAVTSAAVIGATDGNGLNTGLYAIKNVYQLTGMIPSYLMAPGWSEIPAVHAVMAQVSIKINNHWDAWMFTDLPITDNGTALTLDTAATWKNANNYNKNNETVSFPMFVGTDGKYYHASVIRAANFLDLLAENDGIPYHTASNTDASIIANLWLGASSAGRVYDDTLINEKLVKNGICSAAFVGGRWAIWGAHAASYDQENGDTINVSETNVMMLYYISNDFQHRRVRDVDKPLSANDIQAIVAEEQTRLDALVKIGALTYANAFLNTDAIARSDMYNGDYMFTFDVTTTPLAKSLTALVNWVDDGFATYFAVGNESAD
ncbi:MAG: hypothetical protein IJ523_10560 [Succinivibrionaceae bacterium]|nr:hypothetical protein [Succinivibrionaceae bacterium]